VREGGIEFRHWEKIIRKGRGNGASTESKLPDISICSKGPGGIAIRR